MATGQPILTLRPPRSPFRVRVQRREDKRARHQLGGVGIGAGDPNPTCSAGVGLCPFRIPIPPIPSSAKVFTLSGISQCDMDIGYIVV